ncbi:hypothetical protein INQ51_18795 [Maribellus sp. CM-23]|uniref:hypothetical protein n=1 Tax=Maribellus sp. CM-23 TaxID=2781026 RepID=UPI001F2EEAB8|nr:hypothetical protein [Maribellus sp. CM-23]MCE4566375.1 hypothetical protein [Maribellus sp. CM-23]
MKSLIKYSWITLIFIFLSVISQIGGIVYLLSLWISKTINLKFKFKKVLVFLALYSLTTFLVIPFLAPFGGREKIITTPNIKPASFLTNVLNRNYVIKDVNLFLADAAEELEKQNPEIAIRYLDACFPFFNDFPLFPHLSHNDGKKIDFSLVYQDNTGKIINKSKSISGYGVFEAPKSNESNQPDNCKEKGYFQYNFAKYLTLGKINKNLEFSADGNRVLIRSFLKQEQLNKIFIEPHLKQRMNLTDNKIRFHGCKAVRHDDHIHVQIQ